MRRLEIDGGTLLLPTELPRVPNITGGLPWTWNERAQAYLQAPPVEAPRRFIPHPDLYLRAAELDPNDHMGVLTFIEKHGPFGIDPKTPLTMRLAVGPMSEVVGRSLGLVGVLEGDLALEKQFAVARGRLRDMARAGKLGRALGTRWVAEPQLSAEVAIRSLRRLVHIWKGVRPSTGTRPALDHPATYELAVTLRAALAPFVPRVVYLEPNDDLEEAEFVSSPPLYSVLCLQLARHVASEAQYRVCAHCGRDFTAQDRPHNKSGRHRSDSMYCEEACGKLAAQQRYRRRKREAQGRQHRQEAT